MKILLALNLFLGVANIGWAIFRIQDKAWGAIGLNTAVGIMCLFVASMLAFG